MTNHGMLCFRVPLCPCTSLYHQQFFPFMSLCLLLPLECSKWIHDWPFLLNPSCHSFSWWPWFISPSDLIAITASADISPVCPVPLNLAVCETNTYRHAYSSQLSRVVSVGLNCWEVLCEMRNVSAAELCPDKKSRFSFSIICILREYLSCTSWGCFMEDAYPVWKRSIINSVSVNWR